MEENVLKVSYSDTRKSGKIIKRFTRFIHVEHIGAHPLHELVIASSMHHAQELQSIIPTVTLGHSYYDSEAIGVLINETDADLTETEYDKATWAGVVSFQRQTYNRCIAIQYGYILPQYRQNGLYTALIAQLAVFGADNGYTHLQRVVAKTNTPMIKAVMKTGGVMTSYNYKQSITPKNWVGSKKPKAAP